MVFGKQIHHSESRSQIESQNIGGGGFPFQGETRRDNRAVRWVVIVTRAQQQARLLRKLDIVLEKSTVNSGLRGSGRGRRVVVIPSKTRRGTEQKRMILELFVPKVLPERNFLVRQKNGSTIDRVLVVTHHRKLQAHFFVNRQLVLA